MSESEPLNVRVARALGHNVWKCPDCGEWHSSGEEDLTLDDGVLAGPCGCKLHDYVHDDALVLRIIKGNHLTILGKPEPDSTWTVPLIGTQLRDEDLNVVVLLWFCAASEAGVKVIRP